MPSWLLYGISVMLFLGVFPLPYDYYVVLRIVTFLIFSYASIISYRRKNRTLFFIFIFFVILFNPIILFHFSKLSWSFIDILSGTILLVNSNYLKVKI